MPDFRLYHRYETILKRLAMDENRMLIHQKQTMKDLFMATVGDLLILLRDEITSIPEDEGINGMQNMLDQVDAYFKLRIQNKKFN